MLANGAANVPAVRCLSMGKFKSSDSFRVVFFLPQAGLKHPVLIIIMEGSVVIAPTIKSVRWSSGHSPKWVVLSGDIDEEKGLEFEAQFQAAVNCKQDVIPIMIHSMGGCCYTALKIVDTIRASPVPVITIVNGCAMSAAAVIFSCGTERYMTPNSTIMLHDVSIDFLDGKLADIEVETREMRRLNKRMWTLMARNIGKEDNFFDDKLTNKSHVDSYIAPQQALDYGLCTGVGMPRLVTTVSVRTEMVPPPKVALDDIIEDAIEDLPVSRKRRRTTRRR